MYILIYLWLYTYTYIYIYIMFSLPSSADLCAGSPEDSPRVSRRERSCFPGIPRKRQTPTSPSFCMAETPPRRRVRRNLINVKHDQ